MRISNAVHLHGFIAFINHFGVFGAEIDEVPASTEASVAGSEGEQRPEAKKSKKGKKKGRAAAVKEGDSIGVSSLNTTLVMDPSKGTVMLSPSFASKVHS